MAEVKIEMTQSQVEEEEDDGKEESKKYENVTWEYCLMFGNLDPPTEKGNQLPEDNKKMKRFRENEKKRRLLVKRLKNPAVGLMVTRKRSADGKAIFVLLSADQARLERHAEHIELPMRLLPEYGGGYAPFEVEDKKMFVGHDSEFGFFRQNIRHYLIRSIMETDAAYGGAEINVGRLVKAGVITKVYPLHNEQERKFLLDNWAHWRAMFKFQPMAEINNYYGEEIAFYFAWLGFYTSWLWGASALGTIAFILYVADKRRENPAHSYGLWIITIYSVFLAFWATLFLEYWKRTANTLSWNWGMSDFQESEQPRPDYKGKEEYGVYAKGHWLPLDPNRDYGFPLPKKTKYYPSAFRSAKITAGVPLLVTMVIAVVVATFAVLSFRLWVQKANAFGGSLAGGVANAMTIMFLNVFWKTVAVKMTEWENHRTQTEFDNALIVKIFVFYFVNSYTSLYYIAFFKSHNRFWSDPGLQDACKQVIGSSGASTVDVIGWGCVDELTFQLAVILGTNMIFGQAKEVLAPYIISKIQLARFMKAVGEDKETIPQWEADSKLSAFQGTFDEYSEMIIQYGYITLFAAAFPLAPLMAVANNMIEIRTDAFKLLSSTVRPDYKGASGIGNWYGVLEVLGIVAVMTNCLLVGFSFAAISALSSPTHRDFITLVVIVIMEHFILFVKYVIAVLVPDVPGEIVKEQVFQEFCKEQLIKKVTGVKEPAAFATDDLNDVDAMIEEQENEKANPLGLGLSLGAPKDS